jgi:ABC-type phosphate transport system permease subunit
MLAVMLAMFSFAIVMVGDHHFENQIWTEVFLNASMLLPALGPVSEPQIEGGKIFAGCYALYCGLVFLFTAGLLVTSVAHLIAFPLGFVITVWVEQSAKQNEKQQNQL